MVVTGKDIRQLKSLAKLRTRVDKSKCHSNHLNDFSIEYFGVDWNTLIAHYKKQGGSNEI